MKKFTFFTQKLQNLSLITVFLLATTGVVFSCKPDPEPEPTPKDEEEIEYPIDISFTKYSLDGTSCQWTNLIYDDKLTVINSNEILRSYITCTDSSNPEIDFSKWTLLAFNVECCNVDSYIKKMLLQQLSDNKYLLSIDIVPSITANPMPLMITILTPKISNDSLIELNVTIIQN